MRSIVSTILAAGEGIKMGPADRQNACFRIDGDGKDDRAGTRTQGAESAGRWWQLVLARAHEAICRVIQPWMTTRQLWVA